MTFPRFVSPKSTLAAAASALVLAPVLALAGAAVGDVIGTNDDEIRAALEKAGYTIEKIEREDDEIEVYASIDGRTVEIEIASESGKVIEVEDEDHD